MIITVGGLIASGKSTLAREISKRLRYKYISAGDIMRDMAREKGMTLLEFSKIAEKNPSIDKKIDARQKKLATGNCVVDGRLSAYFLKSDFKIWLTAPIEIKAKRLMKREGKKYKNTDNAIDEIKKREENERRRYKDIYNIDLDDLSVYDTVLNTGKFDIPGMTEIALVTIKNIKNR